MAYPLSGWLVPVVAFSTFALTSSTARSPRRSWGSNRAWAPRRPSREIDRDAPERGSAPVRTRSAADTPAQVFQIQCAACHVVDQMLVGPSLVEIAGIYRDRPDEFVKWCITPQHKREGVIEMPSMAHLGEPVLRQLHGYVIAAAEGKTELKKGNGDPYSAPRAMVRRPQVQRIFLPDASPAAIAVALPGDLSFCFDASECRLRYVWKGGFIDGP